MPTVIIYRDVLSTHWIYLIEFFCKSSYYVKTVFTVFANNSIISIWKCPKYACVKTYPNMPHSIFEKRGIEVYILKGNYHENFEKLVIVKLNPLNGNPANLIFTTLIVLKARKRTFLKDLFRNEYFSSKVKYVSWCNLWLYQNELS